MFCLRALQTTIKHSWASAPSCFVPRARPQSKRRRWRRRERTAGDCCPGTFCCHGPQNLVADVRTSYANLIYVQISIKHFNCYLCAKYSAHSSCRDKKTCVINYQFLVSIESRRPHKICVVFNNYIRSSNKISVFGKSSPTLYQYSHQRFQFKLSALRANATMRTMLKLPASNSIDIFIYITAPF